MIDVMTFKPRNSFVLIRRLKRDKTSEGIIIPSGQYGDFAMGEVIDVGPGMPTTAVTTDVFDLEPGQIVMFQAGNQGNPLQGRPARKDTLPFKVGGEDVELLDERMIVGIITQGD